MAVLKCALGLLVLSVVFTWAEEEVVKSTSEKIEKANRDIVRSASGPYVEDDVAYASRSDRNADPCTAGLYNCKWDQFSDGIVYVHYVIADEYTPRERAVIEGALQSFHSVSCIRFFPRTREADYLHIQSLDGCYSYLGRRYNEQPLSISRRGCVYHDVVQHELLHALGFKHEQSRSDRDQHIRVVWENITPGWEYAFDKVNTLNQGTPYDYMSVMQYSKYAFSKNNQPTMEPIPNAHVEFGVATEMSQNDITRLNRLYNCNV